MTRSVQPRQHPHDQQGTFADQGTVVHDATTVQAADADATRVVGSDRPRRPRWVPALILVLVLGLLGAVVGVTDHLTRQYAEDRIAEQVSTEFGLGEPPPVEITGLFFLPQLLGQNIGEVRLSAPRADLAVEGNTFELHDLDLVLRDLSSQDWFDHVTIGELEGTGLLTWSGVAAIVGETLEYGGVDDQGRGRISLDQSIGFEGLQLDITVSGRPEINAGTGQLQLLEPEVAVSGITLPADLVADLVSSRLQPIDLPLPEGFSITELTATEAGLQVRLHGADISF